MAVPYGGSCPRSFLWGLFALPTVRVLLRTPQRRTLRLALAAALALGAAACRQKKSPGLAGPAPIRVATTQEPDALLPAFSDTAGAAQILSCGQRYLTRYSPAWRVQADLAVRVPSLVQGDVVLMDGAGKPTPNAATAATMDVTWQLKPGLHWNDGTALTAADLVAAHHVVMSAGQQVRDRSVAEKVADIRAVDATTLKVTWREPYAFFHAYRNHPVLPAHALAALTHDGGLPDLRTSVLARTPLWMGPYALTRWVAGQYIQMAPSPHTATPPASPALTWQFVASEQAAVAALEAGAVDALAPDGTVGPQAARELVQRHPKELALHLTPGMVWAHLALNMEDPLLAQPKIRAALAAGMDRHAAVTAVFHGQVATATSLFPQHHAGAVTQVLPRFDAQRSRALLAEAGFAPGADGIAVNKAGVKLSFEVVYAAGIKTSEDLLLILADGLRKVGVELRLVAQPVRVLLGETLRQRGYRHLAFLALSWDPMSYGDTVLGSQFIPSTANDHSGQNHMGYRSAAVDALLREIPRTLDDAARAALLVQLNRQAMADLPVLPLYERSLVSVTRRNLTGWAPTGTPTPVCWNAEAWALGGTTALPQ